MYTMYGNIYHQYTPNVGIYIPYMDPMGYNIPFRPFPHVGTAGDAAPTSEVFRPRRSCAPSRTNIGLLLSHFLTQSMKSRKRSKIVSWHHQIVIKHWFMMIYDDLWWFMMMYDHVWWFSNPVFWWFMIIYDDLWWCVMAYDDLWWFTH
jgi:hypothetical protein